MCYRDGSNYLFVDGHAAKFALEKTLDPDNGYALTNYHVAKPCGNAMKCGMADGRLYDAKQTNRPAPSCR